MGLRINTNIASLIAQNSLARATDQLGVSYRRISTGLRITSAADDAAGLSVSERLRAQVRSIDQAKRNANDGISLAKTAEGALAETSSILLRLRELAVQSNTGTVSVSDKETLDDEFSDLVSEIDRLALSAEFNDIMLLDGSASSTSFHIGPGVSDENGISLSLTPALATTLSLESLDIGSGGDASSAIDSIDTAIDTISSLRGRFGATQNRLQYAINHLDSTSENLTAAVSRIRDVDLALETARMTRASIIQKVGVSVLVQANSQPELALRLLAN